MADGQLSIRSYRLCFDLERRIHRVDRWRIPVPYGVPLRGIAYGFAALTAVLLLGRLPVVGALLMILHPALRLVILPVAVAGVLTRVRVDGRHAHAAAFAWLRWRFAPRRLTCLRGAESVGPRFLDDVAVGADEGAARYRPCVVRGPAAVTLRYPAVARRRGRALALRQQGTRPLWRAKRVVLRESQRLRIR